MVKEDRFGTYLRLLVALFKVDDFADMPMICYMFGGLLVAAKL